ncbi:site-2 protease family protein [Balneolaceae bacterium ANBcel3]|nr:site-2 protease family protein [Balneolaceae bacterium ANBcel3]
MIKPDSITIFRHLSLFILTFVSSAFTGALFVGHTAGMPDDFVLFSSEGFQFYMGMVVWEGVLFASLLLGFLTVHEFGHYFAALRHRIHVTLPYFIPFPLSPIGTLGAVIRIKSTIQRSRHMFDVGASGPIAGFIVAVIILLYGFATLPEPEYLHNFAGHESINEYISEHGTFPDEPLIPENDQELEVMVLGNTLLFSFLASFFDHVPPMWEIYHYPFLFAGWLGLFFTALNLLPVGQLDGGHILYTLIGFKRHRIVARSFFVVVLILAGLGVIPLFKSILSDYSIPVTFTSWLLWAGMSLFLLDRAFHHTLSWILPAWIITLVSDVLLLFLFSPEVFSGFTVWIFWALFIVFLVKIEHPPVLFEEPLTKGRKILGWICMVLFILCISPNPIYFIQP